MPAASATVDEFRSFYANYLATVGRRSHWPAGYAFQTRLEGAFEAVPREVFLPPGPWHIEARPGGYIETPSADVRYLYQDVLVAIEKGRGINNGQPGAHARFMSWVEPQPGETVAHIGAGTGYYSAILSLLVAPGGRVEAFEVDEKLAATARRNLKGLEDLSVTVGDATALMIPAADVVYVNAGVISPPLHWLMALRPGGRMFVPWRPARDIGVALLIRRTTSGFDVVPMMPTWFIPCVGASTASSEDKPPDSSAAWETRSLHLTTERKPDATATAIYAEVWFSSERLKSTSGVAQT